MNTPIIIDLNEQFEKLGNAPIIEAIIEVRATAQAVWEETVVSDLLKESLSDYPNKQSLKSIQHEFKMDVSQPVQQSVRDLGWRGLRCESESKKNVAQFFNDSFVFSRLQPYDCWGSFLTEALRLWEIYKKVANPLSVERLGLRYVNRVEVPQGSFQLEDYFSVAPEPPAGFDLPFASFFHQDSYVIPNYPYGANLIKTIQIEKTQGLILDIDIFSNVPSELDPVNMERKLSEMRWVKNKLFYNSLTDKALEGMK